MPSNTRAMCQPLLSVSPLAGSAGAAGPRRLRWNGVAVSPLRLFATCAADRAARDTSSATHCSPSFQPRASCRPMKRAPHLLPAPDPPRFRWLPRHLRGLGNLAAQTRDMLGLPGGRASGHVCKASAAGRAGCGCGCCFGGSGGGAARRQRYSGTGAKQLSLAATGDVAAGSPPRGSGSLGDNFTGWSTFCGWLAAGGMSSSSRASRHCADQARLGWRHVLRLRGSRFCRPHRNGSGCSWSSWRLRLRLR